MGLVKNVFKIIGLCNLLARSWCHSWLAKAPVTFTGQMPAYGIERRKAYGVLAHPTGMAAGNETSEIHNMHHVLALQISLASVRATASTLDQLLQTIQAQAGPAAYHTQVVPHTQALHDEVLLLRRDISAIISSINHQVALCIEQQDSALRED